MFRLVGCSFILLLSMAQNAFAQGEIRVRASDRGDSTRLVFEGEGSAPFENVKNAAGELVIRFPKGTQLEGAAESKTGNILGVDVVSQKPLGISVKFSEGSKTRVFSAGGKVIADIYNAPGAAKKPKEVKPVKEEPKKQEEAKAAVVPDKTPEQKKSEKKPDEQKPEAKAGQPQKVETPPPPPEKQETEKAAGQAPAAKAEGQQPPAPASLPAVSGAPEPSQADLNLPHGGVARHAPGEDAKKENHPPVSNAPSTISMPSAQPLKIAVFEKEGMLWMVHDRANVMVAPQAAGPLFKESPPFKELKAETGRAFLIDPGLIFAPRLSIEGNGLLWRVTLQPGKDAAPDAPVPVIPVRKNVESGKLRSGSIVWPFKGKLTKVEFQDPGSGEKIIAVTVENPAMLSGPLMRFVDFDVVPSAVGMAIVPKVDDLEVAISPAGVEISRKGGLALGEEESFAAALAARQATAEKEKKDRETPADAPESDPGQRVFDFDAWQTGGLEAIDKNRNVILSELREFDKPGRVAGLLDLARMHLSNGLAAEALGFLGFAEAEMPELEGSPEFLALRGAARAFDAKSEDALEDLLSPALEAVPEISYWKSYVLGSLGDWKQAAEILPKSFTPIEKYPDIIYNRLAIGLAEVALRDGRHDAATGMLERIEKQRESLTVPMQAALDYLKGEALRQKGKLDETEKLWAALAGGTDELYRVKAGLALTRLKTQGGKLKPQEVIDALEPLRYAWRGDDLEAQTHYWLGKSYFDAGQYAKGLNILKDTSTLETGGDSEKQVTEEMGRMFAGLFLGEQLDKVSPLDAVALYEQFRELVPPGEAGDKLADRLAERLIKADLLGRAGTLLDGLARRLKGEEAYRTAARLVAIRLLDDKPAEAMAALKLAKEKLAALPAEQQTDEKKRELSLFEARTLSQQGRPDQALALLRDLPSNPDINRLRADIAWTAGYWDDAAEALEQVILDADISLTRPMEPDNAALVLQRAVALNLASDRIGLANMRERWLDAMAQTEKGPVFEVITRPRLNAGLADRETLADIVSETDLFGGFLESYKGVKKDAASKAQNPPPVAQ